MISLRPELKRGIVVLLVFIAFIVTVDTFAPDPFETAQYTRIEARRIAADSESYEGARLSTSVRVESLHVYDENHIRVNTIEGLDLLYPVSFDDIQPGDTLFIRGMVQAEPIVQFTVTDVYSHDVLSSPIRSIPGIAIFVLLLFYTFRFDLKRIALVPRGNRTA